MEVQGGCLDHGGLCGQCQVCKVVRGHGHSNMALLGVFATPETSAPVRIEKEVVCNAGIVGTLAVPNVQECWWPQVQELWKY